MASLFISYSRKDIDFARQLTEAFKDQDLDFWIDWEGIAPTVDWWKEIEKGIEEADIFLFLISSDSCRSKVCRQEIEHAVKNGKRLVPVVVRDIKVDESPAELSSLNWVFLRVQDDFNLSFAKLITAIKTDYAWVQAHRQLQVKALEWERSGHETSFLLRGKELQGAELQLVTNSAKEPFPTGLQREYVLNSRQASDRQRRITMGIAVAGVIALTGLAIYGFVQAGSARRAEATAVSNASVAETQRANAEASQKLAEERASIARAGELAAQSVQVNESDFPLSLLLGIEAFQAWDTLRSHSNLLDVAGDNPQLLQYLAGHTTPVNAAAISPDGRTLATTSDNMILLWDMASRQRIGEIFTGERVATISLVFHPYGDILASGNWDGTINLWDVSTLADKGVQDLQLIGQVRRPYTGKLNSLAFSPDGQTLAAADFGNAIMLWQVSALLNTGIDPPEPVAQSLTGHWSSVLSVAFSPDGQTIASGSEDFSIILWDLKTGQAIGEPLREQQNWITGVAFSRDGKILASASDDGTIILWDVETREPIGPALDGRSGAPKSLAFSPDGRALAASMDQGTILLWDLETRFPLGEPLTGHASPVNQVVFSPDSKTLAAASDDHMVSLWEVATLLDYTGDTRHPLARALEGQTGLVYGIAVSPDGTTLAAGDSDNVVHLWDLETRGPVGEPFTGHQNPILSVAFSPDGRTLASGSADKTIILWDVASRQPIGQPLRGHAEAVDNVIFHPDSRVLASNSRDGTIILWNVETLRPIVQRSTGYIVTSLAFSLDGKVLAAGTEEGPITLWDVDTNGQTLLSLEPAMAGYPAVVYDIAFSPDGSMLASGGNDGAVVLWNVASREILGRPLVGHSAPIHSVTFSPDGQTLVSGAHDYAVILWDVPSRQPIGRPLTGPTITSVTFTPAGKTLASAAIDGRLILWDVSPQSWIEQSCMRAGRNLTRVEWERYFPADPYRKTCEQWPLEPNEEATSSTMPQESVS